ncbi:hypothetical protein BCR42DRAFT_442323 [Absidia repens]|uniref:Uncharacterized protein n=1 Tax=Absidia repens TaxID=90262 RepID=A0A1X2I497_9FUNG|nr:hypothetical protein BCR42DRAFT_442323 [Absidia repens]
MIQFITRSTKPIRLCIITFAGLSNDPRNIEVFLRACKMIKAIVVEQGVASKVLRRHSLLHGDKIGLKHFKSRTGCLQRSM